MGNKVRKRVWGWAVTFAFAFVVQFVPAPEDLRPYLFRLAIIVAAFANMAQVWDAATGQPIGEPLRGHESQVESATFSPDGKRIVTASRDKTARIWDASTGQPIGEPIRGHEDWVLSATFSPDGTRIVTASRDRTARIWDAATGQPIVGPLRGH